MGQVVKELKVDFRIEDESGVRKAFQQLHKEFGFSKILVSRTQFPDYVLKDKKGKRVLAEAEFKATGARNHGRELTDGGCDLIICWYDDWPDCPVEILELSRRIIQPVAFSGFNRENEELRRISEAVKKYDAITEKARQLLKDIGEFVRRKDHQSITIGIQTRSRFYDRLDVPLAYYQRYRRRKWATTYPPVCLEINFDDGNVRIYGEIWAEDSQKIDNRKWMEIIEKIEDENFSLERQLYGTTKLENVETINGFFRELREPNKVARVVFAKNLGLDVLYQKASEIVERLGNAVLWVLSFLEEKRICIEEVPNE